MREEDIQIKHKGYCKFRRELISQIYLDTNEPLCGYVYQILLSYYNPIEGCSYPSYAYITKRYGLCRQTLIKYVKLLEEHGYIRYIKGDKGRANKYVFPLERKIEEYNKNIDNQEDYLSYQPFN